MINLSHDFKPTTRRDQERDKNRAQLAKHRQLALAGEYHHSN